MTPEEILKGLYDETLAGNAPAVLDLTHQALTAGMHTGQVQPDETSGPRGGRRSLRAG